MVLYDFFSVKLAQILRRVCDEILSRHKGGQGTTANAHTRTSNQSCEGIEVSGRSSAARDDDGDGTGRHIHDETGTRFPASPPHLGVFWQFRHGVAPKIQFFQILQLQNFKAHVNVAYFVSRHVQLFQVGKLENVHDRVKVVVRDIEDQQSIRDCVCAEAGRVVVSTS